MAESPRAKCGGALEIIARNFADIHGERESLKSAERRGEFIYCIFRPGNAAMPTGIAGFKLIVRVHLLARLQSRKHPLPLKPFKLAAVQRDAIFGVDPILVL